MFKQEGLLKAQVELWKYEMANATSNERVYMMAGFTAMVRTFEELYDIHFDDQNREEGK